MALGTAEWIIIGVVALLLFGVGSIPKLAKALGRAQGEFRKARREMDAELRRTEAEPAGASEEQVRRTARELGIEEQGRSLDEVKRLINERLA